MSLRLIDAALRNLPPGMWPEAEHPASWTIESYLLASVVDAVRELVYITAKVNGAKSARRPKPVWRPGSPRDTGGQHVSWRDFGRALGGAMRRG